VNIEDGEIEIIPVKVKSRESLLQNYIFVQVDNFQEVSEEEWKQMNREIKDELKDMKKAI
jgi:hypothetical protein